MTDTRVYELRTYIAVPGKVDALVTRFRDHVAALFEKHGITSIGYWVATDDDRKPTDNLVCLVAHDSREAAKGSWEAFLCGPRVGRRSGQWRRGHSQRDDDVPGPDRFLEAALTRTQIPRRSPEQRKDYGQHLHHRAESFR